MPTTVEVQRDILGNGLTTPLQRISGNDFVSASGENLVRSCIAQILGTRPGELPWRPTFGVDLEPYRHKSSSGALAQSVADEIVQAISKWEPRVTISSVVARAEDNVIKATITWALITAAVEGNNVLIGPIDQEVEI